MKKHLLFSVIFLFLSFNCFTIYAQGWKWATGSSCPNADCEGLPVAVDQHGNIYAGGLVLKNRPVDTLKTIFGPYTVIDTDNVGEQGVIVSTDSNGHYRWALATQHGKVFIKQIKVGPSGSIYVLGHALSGQFKIGTTSYVGSPFFIMKLNSNGNIIWVKGTAAAAVDIGCLFINGVGDLFIAGIFLNDTFTIGPSLLTNNGPVGTYDVFYARYDSAANPLGANSLGGDTSEFVHGLSVANDTEIYVVGQYYSATMTIGSDTLTNAFGRTKSNAYIAKFNTRDSALWAKNPYVDSTMFFTAVANDYNGNTYVTGSYSGKVVFATDTLPFTSFSQRPFVLKYDKYGNPKWARTNFKSKGGTDDIEIDNCGNIWISGQMPFSSYSDSMFIVHFDTLGHSIDSVFLSSGGDDANAIALDQKGNVFVCGDYYNDLAVGSTTLLSGVSDESIFIAKYKYGYPDCRLDTIPIIYTKVISNALPQISEITIYPNPATEDITVFSDIEFSANAKAELYDLAGRLINTYGLSGNSTTIPVVNIYPGMYQCRIITGDNHVVTKKLVVMH